MQYSQTMLHLKSQILRESIREAQFRLHKDLEGYISTELIIERASQQVWPKVTASGP